MGIRKGREREKSTFQTKEKHGQICGHHMGKGQVVDTGGGQTRGQVLGTGGGKWCEI